MRCCVRLRDCKQIWQLSTRPLRKGLSKDRFSWARQCSKSVRFSLARRSFLYVVARVFEQFKHFVKKTYLTPVCFDVLPDHILELLRACGRFELRSSALHTNSKLFSYWSNKMYCIHFKLIFMQNTQPNRALLIHISYTVCLYFFKLHPPPVDLGHRECGPAVAESESHWHR